MSDERLRAAGRRWRETGTVDDEAAFLRERVRMGELTDDRLALAAYCGHAAARLTLGGEEPPAASAAWLEGLECWGAPVLLWGVALALFWEREDDCLAQVARLLREDLGRGAPTGERLAGLEVLVCRASLTDQPHVKALNLALSLAEKDRRYAERSDADVVRAAVSLDSSLWSYEYSVRTRCGWDHVFFRSGRPGGRERAIPASASWTPPLGSHRRRPAHRGLLSGLVPIEVTANSRARAGRTIAEWALT